ncbi:MAG: succinate dehydrogenase assembly factor 2 [Marinobacter sp.]|uniref:FAD assembly factor SdhE n=1 Tax=Marinobacter sp. TaxID=50741 RepID=UPI003F9B079A
MQDPKAHADNSEFNRLWWHSRRGMLELDVLLIPFLEEAYRALDTEDQARYKKLLACEDTDMFEWFMQRSRPDDTDLQRIVDIILARVQPD